MFNCGKEEPVTSNESLYGLNRDTGDLILDQSSGVEVNRYSFVERKEKVEGDVPILIRNLLSQLDKNIFVVLCWLAHIPGKSDVASRVIEKRYAKKGFCIYIRDNHYFAIKKISGGDIVKWPPCEIHPRDGGFIIMLGYLDEISMMESINISNTLFLARNKYFVPDKDMLNNLGKKNISVLYQANDELNNFGLVFVGNDFINIEELNRVAPINKVFEGELAYKAFV